MLPIVKLTALGIIPARSTVNGNAMKDSGAHKHKDFERCNAPELTLALRNGNVPDPRLIEFVRLLARHAARRWYEQVDKERLSKRS
ncbi:hypothetical protein [Bradyrhizobium sp. USDA 4529]